MRVGVVFPQTEIGSDPGAIRDYVQASEDLGYDHLIVYDHVLGGDVRHHQWLQERPYRSEHTFHEPFVLFGYMAALTKRIEMVTAVIILGQRQTALVAKQAAEVDVLSGGRLRLGIGTGWNPIEYEALGENFHNRGRRSEEQIALMRALWSDEVVNFDGRWHKVTHAGIKPRPVNQSIPIWLGGRAEAVIKRVGQIADGWFPQFTADDDGKATLERMRNYAREAGRDPSTIGVEGRANFANGNAELWVTQAKTWEDMGATHFSVNTMGAGLTSPQGHIDAIRQFKEAMDG